MRWPMRASGSRGSWSWSVITASKPQKNAVSGYDAPQLGQVRLTTQNASEALLLEQRERVWTRGSRIEDCTVGGGLLWLNPSVATPRCARRATVSPPDRV